MRRLKILKPTSAGILLSYRCTSECKHCMYACSPKWRDEWIDIEALRKVLTQLAPTLAESLIEPARIGINSGLHFTGGEPFLNFRLLLEATRIAKELGIRGTFVETNCFWCVSDEDTRKKLMQLKDAGLSGILISINPFILEYVPFERTERAIRLSKEIFGENLLAYQECFYQQFKSLKLRGTLHFEDYLQQVGLEGLRYAELIAMGRAPYKLGYLYRRYPAKEFFGESCEENLRREWHVHVDNYYNYIAGYCAGISLGDARNLHLICETGINLDEHPILKALVSDMKELYDLAVKKFDYRESRRGYISRCHLCVDIRRHLVKKTTEYQELQPREFYAHLE